MKVVVETPTEFQGAVIGDVTCFARLFIDYCEGDLSRRRGAIVGSEVHGETTVVESLVPLNNMFGYSTDLRSATQVDASSF